MKALLAALTTLLVLTGEPALAHHPFSSEFDLRKPMSLNGVISSVLWANPHSTLEVRVNDTVAGGDVVWTVELDGAAELDLLGWRRELILVGDQVKAEGWVAKNGGNHLGARSVMLKDGKVIRATSAFYETSPAKNAEWNVRLTGTEVTLIGCVMREADYRRAHDMGRGGLLGTGLGRQNDYVLTEAGPAARTANAGATIAASRKTYRLSGNLEQSLGREVGRTIEVEGVIQEPTNATALPGFVIALWYPVGDLCLGQQP